MEPEGSLPHSQASANCPYPGPAQSSPHTHVLPPGDPYIINELAKCNRLLQEQANVAVLSRPDSLVTVLLA